VLDEDRLWSIETGTSAQIIAKMLAVLYPDALTALDITYGAGGFWTEKPSVRVTGLDIDPNRARDRVGDFRELPYDDDTFDVCVFDPPYHTDRGKQKSSIMADRFGHFKDLVELQDAVMAGVSEGWRVSRLGIIVKVQDYCHGSLHICMTDWVRQALDWYPVYQRVDSLRDTKIIDGKWDRQLSAWSRSATYLAFRHGDQRHVPRTRPPERQVRGRKIER
jgi:hypothetical protein